MSRGKNNSYAPNLQELRKETGKTLTTWCTFSSAVKPFFLRQLVCHNIQQLWLSLVTCSSFGCAAALNCCGFLLCVCSKLKPCVLEQTGRNRQHSLEEGGSFAGANAHLDKTRKSKGCKTTERQTNYCSIKTNTKGFQDSCRRDRGIVIYFKTTQF